MRRSAFRAWLEGRIGFPGTQYRMGISRCSSQVAGSIHPNPCNILAIKGLTTFRHPEVARAGVEPSFARLSAKSRLARLPEKSVLKQLSYFGASCLQRFAKGDSRRFGGLQGLNGYTIWVQNMGTAHRGEQTATFFATSAACVHSEFSRKENEQYKWRDPALVQPRPSSPSPSNPHASPSNGCIFEKGCHPDGVRCSPEMAPCAWLGLSIRRSTSIRRSGLDDSPATFSALTDPTGTPSSST
jgi:hypothetical protein